MSARITKLTAAQETILTEVRDEWLAHGLSTQPANRAEAEAGVRAAYVAAGLEPPKIMVWLGSPLAGALGQALVAAHINQVDEQVYEQVDAQVRGQVYEQVGEQVGEQVDEQVYEQVDELVYAQVRGQVGEQVGEQVYAQVGEQVYEQVGAQVRAQVREQVGNWYLGYLGSHLWAYYYAHYDAMERIGVTGLEPIHGAQQVARNAGWWWAYRGFAVLTERPCALHRDQQNRLHNENGPALLYPDGWAVHAWHGVRLPCSPDDVRTWTPDKILAERNAEVRRSMIEIVGWPQFIQAAQLTQVGSGVADPGNPGQELALFDVPQQIFDTDIRVLICTNATAERDGTRHTFGLTVPAEMKDPIEAAAWTFGVTATQYRQLARAC